MPEPQSQPFSNTTQGLLTDIENLLGRRLGQLQEEVMKELGKAATAGASVGGGLGLAALGTVLGGIGFVHLLNKATGMPLWLCYGLASAAACGSAAALVSEGVKKAGDIDLVPEGAGQRLHNRIAGNGR